ncbi:MAG: hypothetical protein IPO63_17760 [Bacteroidetes bacterium]|nr:hypothetical protein [Bacteroidota bacterium]
MGRLKLSIKETRGVSARVAKPRDVAVMRADGPTNRRIMKFNFKTPTLIFAIVGLLIPGFTAPRLLGTSKAIKPRKCGFLVSSVLFWRQLGQLFGATTTISGLILPYFYRHKTVLTVDKLQSLKARLTFFNLLEYIFIQSSLIPLFTSGWTLCYVSDGQNGLELVFTAWLALPILIVFSYIFNQTIKATNN